MEVAKDQNETLTYDKGRKYIREKCQDMSRWAPTRRRGRNECILRMDDKKIEGNRKPASKRPLKHWKDNYHITGLPALVMNKININKSKVINE